jgi:hypothetical protein
MISAKVFASLVISAVDVESVSSDASVIGQQDALVRAIHMRIFHTA